MVDFLLLSDGSSYLLQTDGVSRLIIGTAAAFFPVTLVKTWTFTPQTAGLIRTHTAIWSFDRGLPFFVLADERTGTAYLYENVGIPIDGNNLEGYGYQFENVGIGSNGWIVGRLPIEGRVSDGVGYQHIDVIP